jgi:hypothetical protein
MTTNAAPTPRSGKGSDPVKARPDDEELPPALLDPDDDPPFEPTAAEPTVVVVEVAAVVAVVEAVVLVVVVVLAAVAAAVDAAASSSTAWAILSPAATIAWVAGAAPKLETSAWPVGPRTNLMNWANAVALSAGRPFKGTTR